VFTSLLMGNPPTLVSSQLELVALMAVVLSGSLVSPNGNSNWLEAAVPPAIRVISGLAFFWLPT